MWATASSPTALASSASSPRPDRPHPANTRQHERRGMPGDGHRAYPAVLSLRVGAADPGRRNRRGVWRVRLQVVLKGVDVETSEVLVGALLELGEVVAAVRQEVVRDDP